VLLAGDLETPMAVRIGVGAVFEEFAGSASLAEVVPELGALCRSDEAQVRADACHYLGLSGAAEARPHVRDLLDDPDEEVREIAAESLAMLPDAES
jgi:HEAT repeat protein